MLQLERFSYYQHLSLSGGQERPIFTCRIVDIRGSRFHVLSRIQDAGLDFTGRTNFIAHHLVFMPEEIRQNATPPVILRDWTGWITSWSKEPQMLENEDWSGLKALANRTNVPAQTWQNKTGDAANGYGLLEARAGASFRVDDIADEDVLKLFAESLELLEVRDARRDFRASSWNYTFTTSMQEQDNPADFRWRCIHSDNPAANRFATPDCCPLSAIRALKPKLTDEETRLAQAGRQPPRFAELNVDKENIEEGADVRLEVITDGIPAPIIRWFEIEHNEAKELDGKSGTIQILNPKGRAKRYQVQAYNSLGSADSNIVEISIRAPVRVPSLQRQTASVTKRTLAYAEENPYEILNQRIDAKNRQEKSQAAQLGKNILVTVLTMILIAAAAGVWWKNFERKRLPAIIEGPRIETNDGVVSIAVSVIGASPLTYQWYEGKRLIPSATNSSLPLTGLNLMNSGSFSVIITNAFGAVPSAIAQWQGKPPTITRQPFLQTNNFIVVFAVGASPLAYQWYNERQPIPSATSSSLSLSSSGSYSVMITNAVGAVTSAVFQWDAPQSPFKESFNKKKGGAPGRANLNGIHQ